MKTAGEIKSLLTDEVQRLSPDVIIFDSAQ
jgi:hypothetical protein